MSHIRTQVRAAVKQALTNLATTGANVFVTRTTPVAPESLPALIIYSLEEQSGLDGSASGLRRDISLTVEGVFEAVEDDFDGVCDRISTEVETALGAARQLGGIAYDVVPVSTRLAINGEGEKSMGSCVMTFMVSTRTQIGAPESFA